MDLSENLKPIYLEYMDHSIIPYRNTMEFKRQRLIFDILASPNRELFVVSTAPIKSSESLYLLGVFSESALNHKIKYIVPEYAAGSVEDHVNARLKKLSNSIKSEEMLLEIFEYKKYSQNDWKPFYKGFLPNYTTADSYRVRTRSADTIYRGETIDYVKRKDGLEKSFKNLYDSGEINKRINIEEIVSRIDELCMQPGLFQRDVLLKELQKEFAIPDNLYQELSNAFDEAYRRCNAGASDAWLSTDQRNDKGYRELNGNQLQIICQNISFRKKSTVEKGLLSLTISQIVEFSFQTEWKIFLQEINKLYNELYYNDEAINVIKGIAKRINFKGTTLETKICIAVAFIIDYLSGLYLSDLVSAFFSSLINDFPSTMVQKFTKPSHSSCTRDMQKKLTLFLQIKDIKQARISKFIRDYSLDVPEYPNL